MAPQSRTIVVVTRQGSTRVVDCNAGEEDDVLRGDIEPLLDALGAVIDLEGLDYGVLVVHALEESPCLDCPRRMLPMEAP